ncbi:MAG TPA: DUF1223 domain-containing protein [Candidatus Acidoferrales bacterium]|nr:DUF1223 domain-containing protein [Candidatus Acidoferrales bacterium]
MRTILRVFFVGFAVLAICAVGALSAKAQTTPTPATTAVTAAGRKPVVVELFTSEGCSDCPPAEALALKLEQQPIAGVDVIVLEEHVDYWDHQGWVDPFSSNEWTQRQQVYVAHANGNPYTPEMVVGGQSQFVGSNGRAALAAIEKAARAPETSVTLAAKNPDAGDSQDFTVSVGKVAGDTSGDSAEVWLAVVEDGLHSSVNAGENAGHVLYHAAVVRSLHKIGDAKGNGNTAFTGDARVKFKSSWKRENLRVVVFVQEKKSREILGGASTKIAK